MSKFGKPFQVMTETTGDDGSLQTAVALREVKKVSHTIAAILLGVKKVSRNAATALLDFKKVSRNNAGGFLEVKQGCRNAAATFPTGLSSRNCVSLASSSFQLGRIQQKSKKTEASERSEIG